LLLIVCRLILIDDVRQLAEKEQGGGLAANHDL
jgi:hypothetical protein